MGSLAMDGNGRFSVTRREVNFGLLAGAFLALGRLGAARPVVRPLFDFAIAGGWHHALSVAVDGFAPGEALRLQPAFDNPHDANAIAVWRSDGLMLGYVPRRANGPVAELLRAGATLKAEIVAMLDVTSEDGVPDDLVFTEFTDGDPRVRLSVVG